MSPSISSLSQVCVFVFRTSEIPEIPSGIRCQSATTRLEIDTQAQRAERCVTGLYRGASAQSTAPGSAIGPLSFPLQPPLTERECWSAASEMESLFHSSARAYSPLQLPVL
jgi:hypothetical protein